MHVFENHRARVSTGVNMSLFGLMMFSAAFFGGGVLTAAETTKMVVYEPMYTWRDLEQLYAFPPSTGKGQTIALVSLGGGIWESDLTDYHALVGLDYSMSNIEVVYNPNGSKPDALGNPIEYPQSKDSTLTDQQYNQEFLNTAEATMDLQILTTLAPDAKIRVYFLNTNNYPANILSSLNQVLQMILSEDDQVRADVISMSWGFSESDVLLFKQADPTLFQSVDDNIQTLATKHGVTLCAASGDYGSNGAPDGGLMVLWPSTHPFVLACGGTHLEANALKTKIKSETVWNGDMAGNPAGSTGGVSIIYDKPDYQKGLPKYVTKRGVPDVAFVSANQTHMAAMYWGTVSTCGGTSAATPFWASLVARMNESLADAGLDNVGHFQSQVYGNKKLQGTFFDVMKDDNWLDNGTQPPKSGEVYKAGKGWDACTGWGSPNGVALLEALAEGMSKKK